MKMKSKLKIIFSSLATLSLCSAGIFHFNRESSSLKASEPRYRTQGTNLSQKYKQFTDLKCLASADNSDVRETFILRDTNHINPKGVRYRDLLVVIKSVNQSGTFYTLQAIDYRKGGCDAYYSTIGDEEESNPLSRVFSPKHALEIQLIWDKWRLKNVPNWRAKMQKYLNGPRVQLAKEEYLSLKQLGYKMPKKWQEVK
jgi:hypothetical protein